ncbi:monoamine oxidase [Roseovarius sp. MBR-51]
MAGPLKRRTVLAGLTMAGATSSLAQTRPTNPDVIIIGAGAAGLSAGRALRDKGKTCLIVEAAGRIGGRAFTESQSLGQPFDHGCSWISGSNRNVFTGLARDRGFTLVNHTDAEDHIFGLAGKPATDAEWAAYDRAWGAIERALERAGAQGKDVAAASVIPDLPFGATIQSWIGAMDHGVDFDQLSTVDYWEGAEDQPSYLVREGLGAVVATLAQDLPIVLNSAAHTIDWSGAGVTVETTQGTLRARACLITVSTGVLNAGRIRFRPALPDWKLEAAADIPMGLLVKVPLLFDGARLGLTENAWITYQIPEDRAGEACYFVAWPTGHDYIFGNIGGRLGWELSRAGQEATVDYALEQLVRLVGSDARTHFLRGLATDWAENPLTYGAYGAMRPGQKGARKRLAEPLAKRLYFAGEAMGGAHRTLVNGAYESGKATALRIAKDLN